MLWQQRSRGPRSRLPSSTRKGALVGQRTAIHVSANSERPRIPGSHYPVVIIGGGINGCGLFRDLCLQGVDVLLVEKGDFCSGASAAPSRLIHGGIKYLETGEFRLVKQSAVERNLLIRNAPHYVKPLETVLPINSWFGGIIPSILRFFGRPAKMNDRGAIITEIGLCLYDLFGRQYRGMPRHQFWLRRQALAAMPDLSPGIVAAGSYYEGRVTHAERLGLEVLLDGLQDNPGSCALNHTTILAHRSGMLILRDTVSGAERRVSADIVVNAAGAWIDKVNCSLGINSAHMGGTKGSHVIVHNPALHRALHGRMIYFGSADGRVNLLYPFMDNVLIGATDIPVKDPDTATCSEAEIEYLVSVVKEVFPRIPVDREQVVFTYCGVRPLPRSDAVDPGAVSRDHSVAEDTLPGTKIPVLSLIGGKWTTFRGFAEEVADRILAQLDRPRRASTRELGIGGGNEYPPETSRSAYLNEISQTFGLTTERATTLFERYGTHATAVAAWCREQEDRSLNSLPDYTIAELARICRHELATRLSDILFRRTDIALSGRLSAEVIREVSLIAAPIHGWSDRRLADEVANAKAEATMHGMALAVDNADMATRAAIKSW